MPSTPVLVLIALTVLACAFIVALLLKIRSQHIAAQPVFGSYGGIDRASNPMWRNRASDFWNDVPDYKAMYGAEPASPESEANEQALGDMAEEQKHYIGDALPGFNGIGSKAKEEAPK